VLSFRIISSLSELIKFYSRTCRQVITPDLHHINLALVISPPKYFNFYHSNYSTAVFPNLFRVVAPYRRDT